MKEENFEMQFEFLQPWSTFVMKTKLPPTILEKMIRITDAIVDNVENEESFGHRLVGQIKDELVVKQELLEQEDIMGFFMDIVRQFIIKQYIQSFPYREKEILEEEWYVRMLNMWIVSQKDNEYNPSHTHGGCDISSIMYLKIPEYLPDRKGENNKFFDGGVVFRNNASFDVWGSAMLEIQPQVGDFFIFPAKQDHQVYPFRTADGKGERRSVSFNGVFISKSEDDALRKQQEEQE